jgi:hypothetical protein
MHPDRLRNMVADQGMTAMMHQARPDIVGASLLIEKDGSYTETIAFTNEAAARRGEQLEMPADVEADWRDALSDEPQFADLHHPWFARHS